MRASSSESQRYVRWFTDWPSTHVNAGKTVEVVPVDEIVALLPKVYDSMHMADCPYVDVLMRIRALMRSRDTESRDDNHDGG